MFGGSSQDGHTEVHQEGHQLTIRPPAATAGNNLAGYRTAQTMNFVGGKVQIGVAQAARAGAWTTFGITVDESNWYAFQVADDTLALLSMENGALESAHVPFDQSAHRYWRFRHDAASNVLYWETSTTGTSWHVRHALTPQASIASAEAELSAGTYVEVADPGAAVFDSFGLQVVNP